MLKVYLSVLFDSFQSIEMFAKYLDTLVTLFYTSVIAITVIVCLLWTWKKDVKHFAPDLPFSKFCERECLSADVRFTTWCYSFLRQFWWIWKSQADSYTTDSHSCPWKNISNSLQFIKHVLSLASELDTVQVKYLTFLRIYRFRF